MAQFNYTLQFKTFEEFVNEIRQDMPRYDYAGIVDPSQIIRQVLYCYRDLGIRIYNVKQAVLELKENRVKLPETFHSINFAILCYGRQVLDIPIQGIQLWADVDRPEEDKLYGMVPKYKPYPDPSASCKPEPVVNKTINCCGNVEVEQSFTLENGSCFIKPETDQNGCPVVPIKYDFKVCVDKKGTIYQVVKGNIYNFKHKIHLKMSTRCFDDSILACEGCQPNYETPYTYCISNSFMTIHLPKNTIIYDPYVYINYVSLPCDENGNLLIPAEPVINEYFLYTVKERILENVFINGMDTSVQAKLQYTTQKKIEARYKAKHFVNRPNMKELQNAWRINREAMLRKYIQAFNDYQHHAITRL